MVLLHRFLQPRSENVSVYLGRGDIRMTQHGLNTAQIGAALQQVRGECMAHDVRRQAMKNAGLPAADRQ
jgi:hypothetical protein